MNKKETEKRYVQMIQFDCLICHRPVGMTKDGTTIGCECMMYSAAKFTRAFPSINPFWEFDKFCRTTDDLEVYWSVVALWVKNDPQIPERFDNGHTMEEFMKPYQEAHSEWMLEHPIMICECPDCEGGCNGDPYGIEDDDEPVASKPAKPVVSKPVVKASNPKYEQEVLAF